MSIEAGIDEMGEPWKNMKYVKLPRQPHPFTSFSENLILQKC